MAWLSTLKEFWWLAGAILLLFGFVWRTAIKTNKLMEQINIVKTHDTEIKAVKEDIAELKQEISEMRESLERHIVDQKADIQAINATLFAILDILKDIKSGDEVKAAHQALRKRQLEK